MKKIIVNTKAFLKKWDWLVMGGNRFTGREDVPIEDVAKFERIKYDRATYDVVSDSYIFIKEEE